MTYNEKAVPTHPTQEIEMKRSATTLVASLVLVAIAGPAAAQVVGKIEDCTASDCLDTLLQLRPPFAWHKPDGLQGVT